MPTGFSAHNQRNGKTPAEKLAAHTDRSGGVHACWVWRGAITTTGYGSLGVYGRTQKAHRLAWVTVNGPIPAGLVVRHDCDNRRCVNPAHLRLGTPADNIMDRIMRGGAGMVLTPTVAKEIFESPAKAKELAAKYGVSRSVVNRIKQRKSWALAIAALG